MKPNSESIPDHEAALARLPHGPGFRFVERLVHLEPGSCGTGEYRIRGDEPFLAGHFPGDPLFPGVLMLEACAQLAGIVAQSDPTRSPLVGLKLAALRAARITASARPGETLTIQARVTARMDRLIHAEATASVGGIPAARCELTLAGEIAGG